MHKRGSAERKTENLKQLRVVSTEPNMGLKLTNREIMTQAEIKSQTINQLSPPGAPRDT